LQYLYKEFTIDFIIVKQKERFCTVAIVKEHILWSKFNVSNK
jgi:hypothetical protein